jgi:hypothetical protein
MSPLGFPIRVFDIFQMFLQVWYYVIGLNPRRIESAFEIPSLRKTDIKYNLDEYFGIDVQMKVIDLEFLILSIQLDSPLLP